MRVSVNQQLQIAAGREGLGGDSGQATSLIARPITPTRVRAAGSQCRAEIGMDPPEGSDRCGIPQDAAKHPVAAILSRAKAITMLDPGVPTRDRAFPRANVVIDADIIAKYLAAPTVVIPGDHQYRRTRFPKLRERRENAEAPSRNDGSPLEPELEQISIHDEGTRTPMQMSQELQQLPLYCGLRETEVQVGDDIRWCGEHALILAYQLAVHKLRQVPNEVLSW